MSNFYWAIKWKSYSIEDLLVNDKQKEYIENEWIKNPEHRQSQTFKLNGETYSYNSIDSITKTSQRITDDTKLLYANEAGLHDRSPIINSDGDVVTNWYKKLVTKKEYENYYSKHPSYHLVSKDAGDIWVGFRIAERENGYRPDNIEQCNESEAERLWFYSQKTASC